MKILIATYNKFPNGDAGAVRQASFAQILINLGHEVYVVGMGETLKGETSVYNGIRYTSFRNSKRSIKDRIDNYFNYRKRLHNHLLINHYDVILAVDLPLNALREIKRYSNKYDTIIVHDSVEWYSADEFRLGVLSPEYIKKDYKNRYFFNNDWKIIAISSYLEKHFKAKGIETLRIPAILEVGAYPQKRNTMNKTVIVYAGLPGRKDCFDKILEALALLDVSELSRLQLRIIGISLETLKKRIPMSEDKWKKLNNVIKCYGRVPRDKVIENLLEADFTILMRRAEKRYAKAGFSTKVPESLAFATPVICNYSSDLDRYLHNMENSIIVKENSVESIKEAINIAINLSVSEKEMMSKMAYETAKNYFDIHEYEELLNRFLEG